MWLTRPPPLSRVVRRAEGIRVFPALVNRTTAHPIASADDADRLCQHLAGLPAFMAGRSTWSWSRGRGLVSFLDSARGVKLASRNPACSDRDVVSLRDDAYPDLQLDQVEAEARDLIPPGAALTILRRFVVAGEPVGLVA